MVKYFVAIMGEFPQLKVPMKSVEELDSRGY